MMNSPPNKPYNVMVYLDRTCWNEKSNKLDEYSIQLISQARMLADGKNGVVSCLHFGVFSKEFTTECACVGADRLVSVVWQKANTANHEIPIGQICAKLKTILPDIVIFPTTPEAKEIAARMAVQFQTGLTADCTELSYDAEGFLLQTRPAFGGNLMASIICKKHLPQMASIRKNTFFKTSFHKGKTCSHLSIDLSPGSSNRIIRLESESYETFSLQNAKIIIGIGMGIQKPENIGFLERLAKKMGGVLGATRSVVEAGWLGPEYQIGQTGQSVAPDLYVACGISGSAQHVMGMQRSKRIIAINRDPHAPIFHVSDYGIIGDAVETIQGLLDSEDNLQ